MDILIRGSGVAAACCTHLLRRAGFRVQGEATQRSRLPALMLSDSAQQLICDVFGQPDLFSDLAPVRTRIVSWGADAAPVALPHRAVAISEEQLLDRLATPLTVGTSNAARWTVSTSQPAASHQFGSREAFAMPVDLEDGIEPNACWVESIDRGWLFLITTTPGAGWLLAVGDIMPAPLASSRLIARKVAYLGPLAGRFMAAPRIASPLCGPDWLACGSAAMAFDPLCGDGSAHAIREAILAAAVIQAEANGEDRYSLLSHYWARLTFAFQQHLSICHAYYRSGHTRPWWESEMNAAAEGLAYCDKALKHWQGFHYRLKDFQLHCTGGAQVERDRTNTVR